MVLNFGYYKHPKILIHQYLNIVVLIKLDIKRGLYMYKGEFCQVVTSEKKNYVYTTILAGNSALIFESK